MRFIDGRARGTTPAASTHASESETLTPLLRYSIQTVSGSSIQLFRKETVFIDRIFLNSRAEYVRLPSRCHFNLRFAPSGGSGILVGSPRSYAFNMLSNYFHLLEDARFLSEYSFSSCAQISSSRRSSKLPKASGSGHLFHLTLRGIVEFPVNRARTHSRIQRGFLTLARRREGGRLILCCRLACTSGSGR